MSEDVKQYGETPEDLERLFHEFLVDRGLQYKSRLNPFEMFKAGYEEAERALSAKQPQAGAVDDIGLLIGRAQIACNVIASYIRNHGDSGKYENTKASDHLKRLEEAIATLQSRPSSEREGFVWVPREPTREMHEAGRREMPAEVEYWTQYGVLHCRVKEPHECVPPENVYKAMIAAATKEGQ